MVSQLKAVTDPLLTDAGVFSTTRLDLEGNGDDITITLSIGEDLDFRAKDAFTQAIARAQRSLNACVVVDLANTKRICDSGLELLSMLNQGCWRTAHKIRIVNCKPELELNFSEGLTQEAFNLSGECSSLERP